MQIITIIGLSFIALFIMFIIMKKDKHINDYLLIGVNLFLAGMLVSHDWVSNGITIANFIFSNQITFYLYTIYMIYALSLIAPKKIAFKHAWWVYSFSLLFTLFIVFDFTLFTEYTPDLLLSRYQNPTLMYHIFYKGHSLFVIATQFWVLKLLKQYQAEIKTHYSYIEPIQLNWLTHFILIYIVINILAMLIFLLLNFGILENIDLVYSILNSALVVSLFYLSINGIRQYSLENIQHELQLSQPQNESEKYQKTKLDQTELEQIYLKIQNYFDTEKPYLQTNFKVNDLSNAIRINTYKVSQAINSMSESSFYDLVNSYRVEELKLKLNDSKNHHFTLLAISMDCGFNSKASLNRIFKKHTGITPSSYFQSLKK